MELSDGTRLPTPEYDPNSTAWISHLIDEIATRARAEGVTIAQLRTLEEVLVLARNADWKAQLAIDTKRELILRALVD